MTSQDYVIIAKAINKAMDLTRLAVNDKVVVKMVAATIACACANEDALFDSSRFFALCFKGYEPAPLGQPCQK